jgi:hypothetical protein
MGLALHTMVRQGYGACLTCYGSSGREHDRCGKNQETPVHVSGEHPTYLTILQDLLKRLQDRHVECDEPVAKKAATDATSTTDVSPDTPNVLQTMVQLPIPRMTCRRSSLKNGMSRSKTKGFGRVWRRLIMMHTSNRKKISRFGLKVPTSTKNLSRWSG